MTRSHVVFELDGPHYYIHSEYSDGIDGRLVTEEELVLSAEMNQDIEDREVMLAWLRWEGAADADLDQRIDAQRP